jgi:hypothetical protein
MRVAGSIISYESERRLPFSRQVVVFVFSVRVLYMLLVDICLNIWR